jgi:hypothetical protein
MANEARRDPAQEREEIYRYIEEVPSERPYASFNEDIGRIPTGPARGWRLRAKKAKSCDACEGDLWIEGTDGVMVPCPCREKRAARRTHNRLRAGNWWRGTSLSFAAPPLALIPPEVQEAVGELCGKVKAGNSPADLWLVGGAGSGKSALCAYLAQRLYPSHDAVAEQVGDLVGHLRWLGAVKGEVAVERRLQKLIQAPVLVLDNIDRAIRSWTSTAPFALKSSCASQDLIRLARLLQERHAAMKPTVLTSRAEPEDCPARLASISRLDLVQGLLGTALGVSDPFEDFPNYSKAMLEGAMGKIRSTGSRYSLDFPEAIAQAA